MSTQATAKLVTVDEFDCLPEPIKGGKMELVDGKVVTMAPVAFEHGYLQSEIAATLRDFVRQQRLGRVLVETGFVLRAAPALVRAPDVSFVPREHVPNRQRRLRGSVQIPPALAVEVTSPSDTDAEVHAKVEEYLAAGVARVWVVRPEDGTVTVHRESHDAHVYRPGDTLSSADAAFAVDGFALALDDLFGDPDDTGQ